MTCSKCSTEFEPDSHSDCTLLDETVCPRCTLSDSSLHRCDMVCQARSIKFIDHHPLTDGFMGFGLMAQVTTTTEEFMPSIYRFIYARVSSVDIKLMEMNRLSVVVKMRLAGNPSLLSQAFVKEGWKGMHLSKTLEESEITQMKQPAPLLVVRPQQWLRIAPETLRLSIDGESQPVTLSDRHELVGTPISDPPPSSHHFGSEPEPRGTYSYYGGKLTSVYGPLAFDKDYVIEFDVEAVNPLYCLDFFFPYRFVDLDSLSVSSQPAKGIHAGGPVFGIAKPMVSDKLTPGYEYKLNRPEDEFPKFEKAEPFRNTPPIVAPGKIDFKPTKKNPTSVPKTSSLKTLNLKSIMT